MTPLQKQTYALLKTVPTGQVTTYKELAKAVGSKAYRAIGQFLRKNPHAYITCTDVDLRIPCHRVVASDGSIGGFMGKTNGVHILKKISLLESEGVSIRANKIRDFQRVLYTFPRQP